MSSSSDSDTSTGSSPYMSDNEVKYCKSRSHSIDNDPYTDDIPGFVAEALDETERTEIATMSEQRMKTSGDQFYPKKLKTYIQENEWNIYEQIINEVTEQKGWVFAAPSILQMISQCGHQKPRGVKCDVCHCSPAKPLKVLTFTTEDDSENRYVRYNARLTSMIINHIEEYIGQPLSAVYGVIDGRKHVSDEEFRKRIRVLEIAAQKTSFPQTLHVDGHIYRKMTTSLLDLFSTNNPGPQTASQEADKIPPGNYKQSKMTESMTDDEKHRGTDTDDKRALPNKEESLVARPVAPMKQKMTESIITDDEQRYGTDTDDKRALPNKEKPYVARLVAAVKNMFQKKESQDEVIDHQEVFGWGTKTELNWTPEEALRLREFLLEKHLDKEGNEISLKFLVFGPTGHGKSSFCNGCRSAIKNTDTPPTFHQVAQSDSTFTKGFDMASYENIWIFDMAGTFETKKIRSKALEAIASGKVSFQSEISNTFEVQNEEGEHCSVSEENDLSCVVFVLKYDMELGPELKRQIKVIMKQAGKGVVSCHLVLTCLDECDPQFIDPENLKNIYKSGKVQSAVKRMANHTGIPAYAISFVKNYTTEHKTNFNTTLQYLNVLDRIFKSGLDQVEKRIDKKKHKQLYTKANTKTEERKSTQETGEEIDMEKTKGKDMEGKKTNGLEEKRIEDRENKLSSCQTSNDTDMRISLFVLLVAVIFMFFIWFD